MSVVYNPGLLDDAELIRRFLARGELLEQVLSELSEARPPHRLFVGQRGMGKTTLLRRVAAEVARVPALAARWLALTFPEEQYNVVRLSDLWLNCLDAAADSLQAAGDHARVEAIDRFVAALPEEESVRAEAALAELEGVAGEGRGLLLCIDNLQQLLGRLNETEQWALRKVLGGERPIVVLAASPAMPEHAQDYRAPFYDFFQVERLEGLDFAATLALLRAMAQEAGRADVSATLDAHPARVEAMHTLTGGNPRTIAMLFEVLLASPGEDVRVLLESLVDRATPLYKARFEELADQAQVVLGALAVEWHPCTAGRLAEVTRLEVNTVSTQLTRLFREGLVLKVPIPGESRTGFLVAERFFNLWYLMRASRRLRGRVVGFARCLEALFEAPAIDELALRFLQSSADTEMLGALASLVKSEATRRALWSKLPPAELPELVADRAAVVYGDRVANNQREFAKRMALAAGLDAEGHGVSREAVELAAATTRREELEGGGTEGFWGWVQVLDGVPLELGRSRAALMSALESGLLDGATLPQAEAVNVDAAALRVDFPWLAALIHLLLGRSPASPLLEGCDDVGLLLLAAFAASERRPLLSAAARASASHPREVRGAERIGIMAAALSLGAVEVAVSCAAEWYAGDLDDGTLAGGPGAADRALAHTLGMAAGTAPHLIPAVLAVEPDLRRRAAAVWLMLRLAIVLGDRAALENLAAAIPDEMLPLSVAIDAYLAGSDAGIDRYAPEVREPARRVLAGLNRTERPEAREGPK